MAFILSQLLTTLAGCDDSLSQWDRVSIQVASGVAGAVPGQLVVNAGQDVVTNLAFERTAIVEGSIPVAFQWENVAEGDLLFGSPTDATTTIAAIADGTYTVRVTARGENGEEGSDDFLLTWDSTGPVASETLQTLAGSANGSDVRVTGETNIFLSWGNATDAIVGVRDYTLTWYDAAACAGQATVVAGLTDTLYALTGADGDTFSFRVTAVDELGQETSTGCSPSIRIDTQAPPGLASLTGATGTKLGEITLTLDLPAVIADYDQVTIRRAVGATAPADCASGTAVKILNAADLSSDPLVVADPTGTSAGTFSYRVCVRDQAGNETGVDSVANKVSKHHIIFASSVTYAPTFGGSGLSGADAACATLAQASTQAVVNTEPKWRALLSTSGVNAKDRIQILGRVAAVDDTDFALSSADFWDGNPIAALGMDEFGVYFGPDDVWTGTDSSGVKAADTCSDWGDATISSNATYGIADAPDGQWLDTGAPAACNLTKRIYCITQP